MQLSGAVEWVSIYNRYDAGRDCVIGTRRLAGT